jgi:hypothetical protein
MVAFTVATGTGRRTIWTNRTALSFHSDRRIESALRNTTKFLSTYYSFLGTCAGFASITSWDLLANVICYSPHYTSTTWTAFSFFGDLHKIIIETGNNGTGNRSTEHSFLRT